MPNDINMFVVSGKITREPEYKVTENSKKLLRFTVAINHYSKSGDDYQNNPTFLPIVVWGDYAEYLAAKLEKGMQVTVSGIFNTTKYKQDGKSRVGYNFIARSVIYPLVKFNEGIQSAEEYEDIL